MTLQTRRSLSSLPAGYLAAYLRSQPDTVRQVLYGVLGICPKAMVNSSKGITAQENKPLL